MSGSSVTLTGDSRDGAGVGTTGAGGWVGAAVAGCADVSPVTAGFSVGDCPSVAAGNVPAGSVLPSSTNPAVSQPAIRLHSIKAQRNDGLFP